MFTGGRAVAVRHCKLLSDQCTDGLKDDDSKGKEKHNIFVLFKEDNCIFACM